MVVLVVFYIWVILRLGCRGRDYKKYIIKLKLVWNLKINLLIDGVYM